MKSVYWDCSSKWYLNYYCVTELMQIITCNLLCFADYKSAADVANIYMFSTIQYIYGVFQPLMCIECAIILVLGTKQWGHEETGVLFCH